MRVQSCLLVLLAALIAGGCADEPQYVRLPGPGPAAIPPPPSHPKIEGDVNSVSSADIREVIWLKQQDMVKEYGRALPYLHCPCAQQEPHRSSVLGRGWS